MKKYTFLSIVVVLVGVTLAQEEEQESWLSVSARTGYTSAYVTDFGLECGKGPAWQSEAEFALRNGLYFGVFYTDGIGHPQEPDWREELDLTFGLAREVGGLTIDASITHWDCWQIFGGSSNSDFWYPALEVSKEYKFSDRQTLTPSFKIAFPMAVGEDGDNGVHIFFKATHSLQISEKVSLEAWGSLVRDDGGVGLLPGVLSELGSVVSYQLTKHISVDAGVRGIILLSNDMGEEDVRENGAIFSTNLAFEF